MARCGVAIDHSTEPQLSRRPFPSLLLCQATPGCNNGHELRLELRWCISTCPRQAQAARLTSHFLLAKAWFAHGAGPAVRTLPFPPLSRLPPSRSERYTSYLTPQARAPTTDCSTSNAVHLYRPTSQGICVGVTKQPFADSCPSAYQNLSDLPWRTGLLFRVCSFLDGAGEFNRRTRNVRTRESRGPS